MRIELIEFFHKPHTELLSPVQRRVVNVGSPLVFEPSITHLTEFIGDPKQLPPGVVCVGVIGGLTPQIVLDFRGEKRTFRVSEEKYREVLKLNVPYFEK